LEQRSNGFVFDPSSVDALSEALRRVSESEQQRREMGRRSGEIVAKFSCENFARQAMRAACAAQEAEGMGQAAGLMESSGVAAPPRIDE
jgi:glycosyltransferase involved in cell wall biosynthesis